MAPRIAWIGLGNMGRVRIDSSKISYSHMHLAKVADQIIGNVYELSQQGGF